MGKTVTEFVYLRLKPDVKPEDPENEGGQQFFKILKSVKESRGYEGGSWGRSVENEDDVVWVVGEFLLSLLYTTHSRWIIPCYGRIYITLGERT